MGGDSKNHDEVTSLQRGNTLLLHMSTISNVVYCVYKTVLDCNSESLFPAESDCEFWIDELSLDFVSDCSGCCLLL